MVCLLCCFLVVVRWGRKKAGSIRDTTAVGIINGVFVFVVKWREKKLGETGLIN